MTKKQETQPAVEVFSLSSMNEVEDCNHAEEMVYIDPRTDKETPFVLMVLGAQADSIQSDVFKQIDSDARRNFKAERSGKVAEPRKISDKMSEGIASIANRVVGWSGTDDIYSRDLCLKIMTNNPSLREQVQAFSEDLGNFGNSK